MKLYATARSISYYDFEIAGSDGTGLIVCAYCPYGHTEVYELLLTVLGSITDKAALKDWLNNVWIPIVTN